MSAGFFFLRYVEFKGFDVQHFHFLFSFSCYVYITKAVQVLADIYKYGFYRALILA
jgi:hypothetical protein